MADNQKNPNQGQGQDWNQRQGENPGQQQGQQGGTPRPNPSGPDRTTGREDQPDSSQIDRDRQQQQGDRTGGQGSNPEQNR